MLRGAILPALMTALLVPAPAFAQAATSSAPVLVTRLLDRPIITPEVHPSVGPNIQGPSLIRVPDWVPGRLGRYYLYFADHKGRYIRLAFADSVLGPWKIHVPGSLQLDGSFLLTDPPAGPAEALEKLRATPKPANVSHDLFTEATTPHIASPDVHVDEANRRIIMYYHGLNGLQEQVTRVATSRDGVRFDAMPEILGRTYFRVFPHRGFTYALAMPGQLYRSQNALSGFERGPLLFNPNMRHSALLKRGNTLFVFWTQVGDAPESILVSTIDLSNDWATWSPTAPIEVLRPQRQWEGADAPALPSVRSTAYGHVNQLRDPAVFEEDGRVYLLYAVAGESGIAIAEVTFTRGIVGAQVFEDDKHENGRCGCLDSLVDDAVPCTGNDVAGPHHGDCADVHSSERNREPRTHRWYV